MFGPAFPAMLLFEKFGQHQPLNRQRYRYAREGFDLSLVTLTDQVAACSAALLPLYKLIEAHVLAAQRLHAHDTTVPVLARHKTDTGRIWAYVRDDRPFGSQAPPAVIDHYPRNRRGEHPVTHLTGWHGLLQADAYGGYNGLVDPQRRPAPVTRALCWAYSRRCFFKSADAAAQLKQRRKTKIVVAPPAVEAVRQIDVIFAIERAITGQSADERLAVRREQVAPLVAAFHDWMVEHRGKLSRVSDVPVAMDYMLGDWAGFTAFLGDGHLRMTNNAAERAMRGIAIGRKAWLVYGSDRGVQRAARMYSLIGTAKLADVDPQTWLADALARFAGHPAQRLDELSPWHWKAARAAPVAEAA